MAAEAPATLQPCSHAPRVTEGGRSAQRLVRENQAGEARIAALVKRCGAPDARSPTPVSAAHLSHFRPTARLTSGAPDATRARARLSPPPKPKPSKPHSSPHCAGGPAPARRGRPTRRGAARRVAELEFDVACARGEAARERAGRAAPPAPALDALDALIARAAAGTQGPPARRRRLAPRSGKTLRPFDGAGLVRPAPRAPRPAPRAAAAALHAR